MGSHSVAYTLTVQWSQGSNQHYYVCLDTSTPSVLCTASHKAPADATVLLCHVVKLNNTRRPGSLVPHLPPAASAAIETPV